MCGSLRHRASPSAMDSGGRPAASDGGGEGSDGYRRHYREFRLTIVLSAKRSLAGNDRTPMRQRHASSAVAGTGSPRVVKCHVPVFCLTIVRKYANILKEGKGCLRRM
jgi:hypothetical protein